jgi:hypothetical protein
MTPAERRAMSVGSRVCWDGPCTSYGTVTGIDTRLITVEWDDGQITHEPTCGKALAYISLLPEGVQP